MGVWEITSVVEICNVDKQDQNETMRQLIVEFYVVNEKMDIFMTKIRLLQSNVSLIFFSRRVNFCLIIVLFKQNRIHSFTIIHLVWSNFRRWFTVQSCFTATFISHFGWYQRAYSQYCSWARLRCASPRHCYTLTVNDTLVLFGAPVLNKALCRTPKSTSEPFLGLSFPSL